MLGSKGWTWLLVFLLLVGWRTALAGEKPDPAQKVLRPAVNGGEMEKQDRRRSHGGRHDHSPDNTIRFGSGSSLFFGITSNRDEDRGRHGDWGRHDGWRHDGWRHDGWRHHGGRHDGWRHDPWRHDPWRHHGWRDHHTNTVQYVYPLDNSCSVEVGRACWGCSIACPAGESAVCSPWREQTFGQQVLCLRQPDCSCR